MQLSVAGFVAVKSAPLIFVQLISQLNEVAFQKKLAIQVQIRGLLAKVRFV